jgi:thioesterase domain-containing protein
MAEHYIKVIRKKQPEGPYYLAGFCFGGNVAFEMARQLVEQGHKVAMLALIESWAPKPARVKLDWRTTRDYAVNLWHWLRALVLQNPGVILKRIAFRLRRLKKHFGRPVEERSQPALDEIIHVEEYPEGYLRHAEAHWAALSQYQPKPYAGPATAFRVRSHGLASYDSTLRWRYVCSGPLDVRTIPGTHDSLFDGSNVDILARELKDVLERARETKEGTR